MKSIKELRRERGITQAELCRAIKIAQPTLSGYEQGLHEPDTETLIKLANFFGVSVDYLLGLDGGTESASVAPMGETLTASERELLACFRKLTHGMQEVILTTVRAMNGEDGSALHRRA